MNWEELKEEAKKMDETNNKKRIDIGNISFYEDGQIWVFSGCSKCNISLDRTPDQMLAIMKALL